MKVYTQTARPIIAILLLLGFAAAHAAGGFTVTRDQEKSIAVGMTTSEVQQALGRPAINEKFRNEPGPTWSYDLIGFANRPALLDIDFGSNGHVTSVSERELETH